MRDPALPRKTTALEDKLTRELPADSVVADALTKALHLGYPHVDTAYDYKNAAGIKTAIAKSGRPRSKLFITTKVEGGLSFENTTREAEVSHPLAHRTPDCEGPALGRAGHQTEVCQKLFGGMRCLEPHVWPHGRPAVEAIIALKVGARKTTN